VKPPPEPEAPREGRLGRVVVAAVAFALIAPVGLVTLPLAVLALMSRPRTAAEVITAGVATPFSLWWLLQPGTLADETSRAAAVIATATFVLATRYSNSSVTHRALLSAAVAAVGLAALFLAGPWAWGDVRFWVEHRTSFAVRVILAPFWLRASASGGAGVALVSDLERWFESSVRFLADHYGAVLALQLMAGLGLAWVVYHRVMKHPIAAPAGRFRDFRFTEHIGWVAVAALTVVLVPRLAAAKLAAANLLLVTGALYALRGAAVAIFGLTAAGGASAATALLAALAVVFILPAVVAGTIVLGVVDAGFDLRRRWAGRAGGARR
jgi:hypothetical protein